MRSPFTALLFMICASSIGAARAHGASEVNVAVDPRIELLAAVQLVSGYDEWTDLITRHDFTYKADMLAHFEPFKDHRAVELFAEMAPQGFAFDAPVSAVLHLTDPPELAPIAPFPESLPPRAGGEERLDEFIAALRDFAADSAFMEFYAAHQPFYETVNGNVRAKVEAEAIGVLEDYYGVRQHSYRIIPAPLLHSGGFGPRIRHADGRFDVYSVCGPRGAEDDVPSFGTAEGFRHLVWHEFSHSFVNPVVDLHVDELNRHDALFRPLRPAMSKQAYSDWITCVYEHVVRAATTRMTFREQGEEAGKKVQGYEVSRSFVHVPALAERLVAYEENRDRYPTFESFFPELIDVFAKAAEDMPEVVPVAPTVIRSVPNTGARDVDPTVTVLLVEFDLDMDEGGFAWTQRSNDDFPQTTGMPQWRTPRICVLPVKLKPNHDYWLGLNAGGFRGFVSADGAAAEEYILQFRTAASADEAQPTEAPKVVRTVPDTGASGVDPSITELVAEFDQDMHPTSYAWVQRSNDTYPETTGRAFFRTPRICVLPVKLEPGKTYWLGLNVAPFTAFKSVNGMMAEEFVLHFTTAED